MTPTSNQQPQPQDLTTQRDVASCEGLEPRGRRQVTRSGRAEEGRRSTRNPRRVKDRRDVRNGGDLGARRKNVDIKYRFSICQLR